MPTASRPTCGSYEYQPYGCEKVNSHSDTLPGSLAAWNKMPYVEGAGVIVVNIGMSQLLYARALLSGVPMRMIKPMHGHVHIHLPHPLMCICASSHVPAPVLFQTGFGKSPKQYSNYTVPCAELLHGSAYFWDAGHYGSTDFLTEHEVAAHPNALPGELRVALVFRAIEPEHARFYRTSKHPYRMLSKEHEECVRRLRPEAAIARSRTIVRVLQGLPELAGVLEIRAMIAELVVAGGVSNFPRSRNRGTLPVRERSSARPDVWA